jgi:D-alanyl-D-alanine carboxypeptidase/D-alanyl-D-alanine-endopeptidase (penicillin-binding protein 4)
MYLSRRQILSLFLSSAAFPVWADARPPKRVKAPPPADISGIIKRFSPSGTHSIVVADAVTGRVIEASNGDKSLPPASVAKALTTIYALQNLGGSWRFKTRLVASGSRIENGILQGDLTLEGGGDPALDTDGLVDLIKQLRARGITGISGRFGIYAGALPYQRLLDREQQEHVGYNPTISGVNLNFNRVFMEWKRSGEGHAFAFSAKTKAYKPEVRGVSIRAVNRKEPIYKYTQSGGRDNWTVSAPALGNKGNRWLPVRNPADYAGEVFGRLAADNGISLPVHQTVKKAPKGAVLAHGESAPLSAICKSMLKYSTNLTAETVGLSASVKRGLKPSSVSQSARAMSDWLGKRFGVRDVRMVDHSGLSEDSRVSAREMTRVLSAVGWNGPLRPLMKSIGLRDQNWKKAPIGGVKVMAKTGTLNFTSALAGYLETASGQRLVFAIFTVDQRARSAIPKSKRDRAPGAKEWARKSRVMQHQLLARWGRVY